VNTFAKAMLERVVNECLDIDPSTLTEEDRLALFARKVVIECARVVDYKSSIRLSEAFDLRLEEIYPHLEARMR